VADPARAAAPLALGALLRLAAAGGPFRWARPARNALASLLRRDITAPVRKPWSAYVDLDEVRVLDARVFLGPVLETPPLLACSVLDLAAADAAAGCPLAERMRAWPRIAAADQHLHDQVLAAHHGLLIVGIDALSRWRQDWLHYIGTGSS
jgi:hypothetical protein